MYNLRFIEDLGEPYPGKPVNPEQVVSRLSVPEEK
jgi:hypothetical protein